jgi:predicted amidophosphoribosyltransferase
MPLISCPECKKEFSDEARACPNCGKPWKEFKIPPFYIIVAPIGLLVVAAGIAFMFDK